MEVDRRFHGRQKQRDDQGNADGGEGDVVELQIVHDVKGNQKLRQESAEKLSGQSGSTRQT